MRNFTDKFRHQASLQGFSLLEVLIGIAIFAIGMLALASLQGALTRSTAEAKVRTTAVNIAEQIIEGQRGFAALVSGGAFSFADIVDVPIDAAIYFDGEMTRYAEPPDPPVGVTYTVTQDVTDWYYDLATDAFTETEPEGAITSDYKTLLVTVAWNDNREYVIDEDQNPVDLGGGFVEVSASISSISVATAAQVAEQDEEDIIAPVISYTPGLNPDIVSLELGDSKFKESLLPEPDVIRNDELVETRFDVITYSQTDNGAQFLRREEFAVVSCECTLKAADEDVTTRRPAIWAGDEYVRGQHALKPYGISANRQQSPLCTACCQDHHDGGSATDPVDHADTAVNTFVPFKPSSEFFTSGTFSGDHKHYSRPRIGDPVVVETANNDYVEACRLVRVDGFFRVAQDFRREDLNIFPNDFLDDHDEIDVYSTYVTGAAGGYVVQTFPDADYETAPPCIGDSPCTVAGPVKQGAYDAPIATDGDGHPIELPSWTTLPAAISDNCGDDFGVSEPCQRLRSRGVYIDYLSSDLRYVLENCDPDNDDADSDNCRSGDVVLDRTGSVNTLELVPFFDVQMTKLNRWNEAPVNVPVDATNEPLKDLNAHSRGVISKSEDGESTVAATGHKGNLGFTDTLPIDPLYDSEVISTSLFVHAGSPSEPPPGITLSGTLTETVAGNPNIVVTGINGVQCGQTSATYSCFIPDGTVNPRLEISEYGRVNTDRWACSTGVNPALVLNNQVTNGTAAKAVYELEGQVEGTTYNFVIQQSACT